MRLVVSVCMHAYYIYWYVLSMFVQSYLFKALTPGPALGKEALGEVNLVAPNEIEK